jgi:hypothetical protein
VYHTGSAVLQFACTVCGFPTEVKLTDIIQSSAPLQALVAYLVWRGVRFGNQLRCGGLIAAVSRLASGAQQRRDRRVLLGQLCGVCAVEGGLHACARAGQHVQVRLLVRLRETKAQKQVRQWVLGRVMRTIAWCTDGNNREHTVGSAWPAGKQATAGQLSTSVSAPRGS